MESSSLIRSTLNDLHIDRQKADIEGRLIRVMQLWDQITMLESRLQMRGAL